MNKSDAVPAPSPPVPARRVETVDLLRGLVMVVMALDHTRDFFHDPAVHGIDPTNLAQTTPAIFLTRWVTHFCAPVFCFLAGTAVSLSARRGRNLGRLSGFLVTRGAWLILVETTVLYWVMTWTLPLHFDWGLILWALGWSMIVLAGLIHLPRRVVAGFGLALILGHNAFDSVKPAAWGSWSWLWQVLHVQSVIPVTPTFNFLVAYPLVPWLGVMAAGYTFGAVFELDATLRKKWLVGLGLGLIAGFVLLRFSNTYGDPRPWSRQSGETLTVLSFLNCAKYPPSLCFLLMTLGPAILLLGLLEGRPWVRLKPLQVFGRVPFFYYVVHITLIHGLCALLNALRFGSPVVARNAAGVLPAGSGVGLATVYLIWIAVVAALYPLCRWFAGVKARRREAWLSYF